MPRRAALLHHEIATAVSSPGIFGARRQRAAASARTSRLASRKRPSPPMKSYRYLRRPLPDSANVVRARRRRAMERPPGRRSGRRRTINSVNCDRGATAMPASRRRAEPARASVDAACRSELNSFAVSAVGKEGVSTA